MAGYLIHTVNNNRFIVDKYRVSVEYSIVQPVADLYPHHSRRRNKVLTPENIRPEHLDQLLGTIDAARAAGVNPQNIRDWKRHGHLEPSGLDKHNRPMYRLIDVLKAEKRTSERRRGKGK